MTFTLKGIPGKGLIDCKMTVGMDAFVRWERPEDVTRMREWVTRSRKGACVDGGKGLLEKTAEKCAYEGESARTGMAAHSRVHPLSCKPTLAWNEIRRTQKVFKIPVKNPSTPAKEGKVRFVCMSDTHNRTKNLPFVVPKGDVLIHAGDFTYIGETEEITAFNEWLGELPHKFKVVIAGNHELSFDPLYEGKLPEVLRATHIGHGVLSPIPRRGQAGDHLASDVNRKAAEQAKKLLTNAIYLEDSSTMLYGIKIYGTPWQPEFGQGAFNLPRGEECLAKWDLIPDDTDILVSHGPPLGHGDHTASGNRAGCVELLSIVQNRVKPLYHVFGHIHEGYGITTDGKIIFINASTCNISYNPVNVPIVFDIDAKGKGPTSL